MDADSKFQASPEHSSYQNLPMIDVQKEKIKVILEIEGGKEWDDTLGSSKISIYSV